MAFNPPYAITLDAGSSLANKTGSWRTEQPLYLDRLPPCNVSCPAGENIQAWLGLTQEGRYREAWEEIVINNPLPAIHGRVCYHPCEDSCNRTSLEQPVNIHAIERFLGDLALQEGWPLPTPAEASGKHILVIGGGPGGLSAAYHLRQLGHEVTLMDAKPAAGGMLRYGIPAYRLPRDILDAEIERIQRSGVHIKVDTSIDNLANTLHDNRYDATFLAVGAHVGRHIDLKTDQSVPLTDAVDFLNGMESSPSSPSLGNRVVVYGGGNTAIDVARTAVRLGAEQVTIVYRRTQEKMPAHAFEIEEALEEGVELRALRTITAITDGKLQLETMELDADGWPQPSGGSETLAADSLVYALGQTVNAALLQGYPQIEVAADGTISVDERMMTAAEGLFAGGDMVPADRTITTAVGHGKKAARHIHHYLNDQQLQPRAKHETAEFDLLNTWYYPEEPMRSQPLLEMQQRTTTFNEVLDGLGELSSKLEAQRCMSCGNCFECDNCYAVCPDNAITKLGRGNRFAIDYDYCKGCGLCVEECPCGAMKMVPEIG